MDNLEQHQAYLRALEHTPLTSLQDDYSKLKANYEALQARYARVLDTVERSNEAILRVAREGKTEL